MKKFVSPISGLISERKTGGNFFQEKDHTFFSPPPNVQSQSIISLDQQLESSILLVSNQKSLTDHIFFISSVRSSYSDDGLQETVQLFQIFTQSIDSIDVTSVTLGHLNSINAIDVIRC